MVSNKLPQLKRLRDSERGKIETEKLVEHLKKIDDELKTIGPKIRDNYILSSTPKASEEQAAVIQPYVTIGNDQSQAYCLVQ